MSNGPSTPLNGQAPTVDGLFRRAALRNPDAPALSDPANKAWFTDGEPLHVTFGQADRIVWAIAARLHALGLQGGDIVAIQLPNTVESALTLLGILRGGMVAAPLPMLWRENEIVAALSGTGAKALITSARIGEIDQCDIAMKAAAQLMSIRQVCAFGRNLPDGVTPLDDLLTTRGFDLLATGVRGDNPAALTAVITFEATARGIAAVPRTHAQLIAGGIDVGGAAGMTADMTTLSATPMSSFAGLCVTMLPALLLGGRLVLHQPFDAAVFVEAAHRCDAVVLPGMLVQDCADGGLLGRSSRIIALWTAPHRAEGAPSLPQGHLITDVRAFGEAGLVATPRPAGAAIAPLVQGNLGDRIELKCTEAGTLALRGATVAGSAPGVSPADFVDTGCPCRVDASDRIPIGGLPAGVLGIGGYRIARGDLDALATILQTDEPIAPLPDALLGQRLAGSSSRTSLEELLIARGINPLIAGAFRPRRAARAAALTER
jgi:hypothetical protein